MTKLKWSILIIWLLCILIGVIIYISNPSIITAQNLANFITEFSDHILYTYIAISMLRGFTLVPSTPFVIAGTMLFPHRLPLILFISVASIMFSSTIIYYFSHFMKFGEYFEKKYPKKIDYVKNHINGKRGFFFIVLWCILPMVPTDIVCYVAGTIKMKFGRFIIAIFLGELPICALYVFIGQFISFSIGHH